MKRRILLFVLLVTSISLNAQVFREYFETAPIGENLEGYNDWYVSFKSSEAYGVSPKIEEGALWHETYKGADIGNVALLDSLIGQEKATQRISTKLVSFGSDTLMPGESGKMYAAFLVTVLPDSWGSWRDFFTWEGSSGSSWTRGRVFAKIDGTDLHLGISKNSSSSGNIVAAEVIEGGVDLTQLLVLVYEVVEGEGNDLVHLYVNPDPTKPEAEQTNVLTSIDEQSDYNPTTKIKINLRQRGIGAYVGGIRVGTNWNDVMQGPATKTLDMQEPQERAIRSYRRTILTDEAGTVQVFDITGRQVLNSRTNGNIQTSLQNGIYLVRFKNDLGKIITGKVSLNEY